MKVFNVRKSFIICYAARVERHQVLVIIDHIILTRLWQHRLRRSARRGNHRSQFMTSLRPVGAACASCNATEAQTKFEEAGPGKDCPLQFGTRIARSSAAQEIMSRSGRSRASRIFVTAATIGTAAFLAWAPAGKAEDGAKGRALWAEKGECAVCHGWAGDGVGGADHNAPSMRKTQLTRAKIRETIQCGRPGTEMPYFDRFAYTDKRCYDKTAEELGDQMPNRAPTTLQPYEIDPLADYVATKITGAGAVTRAECLQFFGGTGAQCDKYPER